MDRPSWDEYFLSVAEVISRRATCPRASVGAVIVRGTRIIATGYNGAAPGEPHCIDVGCDVYLSHCRRAVHAEMNVVAMAAKYGISVDGATLYYWDSLDRSMFDCVKCTQIMKAAGIAWVISRSGKERLISS